MALVLSLDASFLTTLNNAVIAYLLNCILVHRHPPNHGFRPSFVLVGACSFLVNVNFDPKPSISCNLVNHYFQSSLTLCLALRSKAPTRNSRNKLDAGCKTRQ